MITVELLELPASSGSQILALGSGSALAGADRRQTHHTPPKPLANDLYCRGKLRKTAENYFPVLWAPSEAVPPTSRSSSSLLSTWWEWKSPPSGAKRLSAVRRPQGRRTHLQSVPIGQSWCGKLRKTTGGLRLRLCLSFFVTVFVLPHYESVFITK